MQKVVKITLKGGYMPEKNELFEKLDAMNREAELGGGEKRIEKQHKSGKLTARERLDKFFDKGTFEEVGKFVVHRCTDFGMDKNHILGDGVVTGFGKVNGRLVYAFAQDFTSFGGSLSLSHAEKICKIMDMAAKNGAPVVGLNDSGGARIQEGITSLAGYAEIFLRNTIYSGVVPQIAAILGPCAGGAVYSPAIMDFIIMTKKTSYMYITGPQVVKAVTSEEVTHEALGGANTHMRKSGNVHLACKNDEETIEKVKELLSYLPQSNREKPPVVETNDDPEKIIPELNNVIPGDPKKPYDMKKIIKLIADNGKFLEIQPDFAPNIIVGFLRLNGKTVGVIANQPAWLAGCLDINSSDKCARFVRTCDCFNIPLLILEDVPGYLPGTNQEYGGIIRHGAKVIFAFAEATVPKITVITRKAYGGAYCAMNPRHLRADYVFAYPTAEISVMGPEGAINIVFRKELEKADDPNAVRQKLINEYRDKFANPYKGANLGYIDAVIKPEVTRKLLIKAYATLEDKKDSNPYKKHSNIPL
jgi:propionyl-CoA carboxylase beta chain